MKQLRDFYVKYMGALALGVALYALFVVDHVRPFIESRAPDSEILNGIAGLLTSRLTIVAILFLGDQVIRKWLWRRLHPELDFAGTWKGTTTYATDWTSSGAPEGTSTSQEVVLQQSSLELTLPPSVGADFTFESRTIDIRDGGNRLVYAYHVQYTANAPNRPDEAYGYEELAVIKTKKKRPVELKGWF